MQLRDGQEPDKGLNAVLSPLIEQLTGQADPLAAALPAVPVPSPTPRQQLQSAAATSEQPGVPEATQRIGSGSQAASTTASPVGAVAVPGPTRGEPREPRRIQPNPLAPVLGFSGPATIVDKPMPHAAGQALQAELLHRLEMGQIRPEEMACFREASSDPTVDQDLMWILFHVTQLEKHRLHLIEHLRVQLHSP